jgi:hypothetical protein
LSRPSWKRKRPGQSIGSSGPRSMIPIDEGLLSLFCTATLRIRWISQLICEPFLRSRGVKPLKSLDPISWLRTPHRNLMRCSQADIRSFRSEETGSPPSSSPSRGICSPSLISFGNCLDSPIGIFRRENRLPQKNRVRVLWVRKHGSRRSGFNHLAFLHDDHAIADVIGRGQIVSNVNDRHF